MIAGWLKDLGLMARVYDGRKVHANVPLSNFKGQIAVGDDVQVQTNDPTDRYGASRPGTFARGKVVRIEAVVEVDLSTVDAAIPPEQGQLI